MNLNVPRQAALPGGLPAGGTASATGNPRNKVFLKPGHSLMDWIRLGKSGQDLTGVGGRKLQVTQEELAKHNKIDDAWMAVRGYVYNVTAYMEYHPGGESELMRGVGTDATQLFDEVHRWVNFQSMLSACLVGKYVDTAPARGPGRSSQAKAVKSSSLSVSSLSSLKPPDVAVAAAPTLSVPPPQKTKPRHEWLQTEGAVTVIVYTKWKDIQHEHIIIDRQKKKLNLLALVDDFTYGVEYELENDIQDGYNVRVHRPSGKVVVELAKTEKGTQWSKLGEATNGGETWGPTSKRALVYWECPLVSREPVTHDTHLYGLQLPAGCRMCVPIGHHVFVKKNVEGMEVVRAYTVVPPGLAGQSTNTQDSMGASLYLMIKTYSSGALTPHIAALDIGGTLSVSQYAGDFVASRLETCSALVLCAAGTGLTPMAALLSHMLCAQSDRQIYLLFFNKDIKDILWKEQLETIKDSHPNFHLVHILSAAESTWSGPTGRIRQDILEQFIPKQKEGGAALLCACGPTPFTKEAIRLGEIHGFTKQNMHAFLG